MEAGYIVDGIYAKYATKIRVTLKERYHQADRKMFLCFWIDRDYFKRTYPNMYNRF